jgi:hypothetical protein
VSSAQGSPPNNLARSSALTSASCRWHGQVLGWQAHTQRNVTDHLPQTERPLVQRRLRAAWALAEQARAELEQLARSLDRKRPGAAASLREGLAQTLTVTRLGSAATSCKRWRRPTRWSR